MPVTTIETGKEWEKWLSVRDDEAANDLIKHYMPLVAYHVQRIRAGLPKSVSKEELISHGMLGLYDALKKFDETRELKFDTYASFRIRGAIIDGLRKGDWLPRSLREKIKLVETAIEKLEQERMRHVSLEEVAEECSMTPDEVGNIISEGFFSSILSIDRDQTQDHAHGETALILEDEKMKNPADYLIEEEVHKELAKQISLLKKKEQLVISLFYYEELSLTEIGQVLGLSTSRISQIHSKALFKLKQTMLK